MSTYVTRVEYRLTTGKTMPPTPARLPVQIHAIPDGATNTDTPALCGSPRTPYDADPQQNFPPSRALYAYPICPTCEYKAGLGA